MSLSNSDYCIKRLIPEVMDALCTQMNWIKAGAVKNTLRRNEHSC